MVKSQELSSSPDTRKSRDGQCFNHLSTFDHPLEYDVNQNKEGCVSAFSKAGKTEATLFPPVVLPVEKNSSFACPALRQSRPGPD